IFNLLPIPALDGGKLLFMAIEKIKGKPILAKTENSITMVFFVLLIGLSLFVTIRFDIPKFLEFVKSGF
ncbi:MAG: site-2 protease family protein, partial [Candidatus Nealsonbacteria bacterium]|nr:site-2 protease family protein [Candidatus Nealsonbacteria bacterium]